MRDEKSVWVLSNYMHLERDMGGILLVIHKHPSLEFLHLAQSMNFKDFHMFALDESEIT